MINEVNKISEEFLKGLEQELSYANEDVVALAMGDDDDLVKVYEDNFIKYLLPFMLNLVDKADEDNTKAFMHNWINLAGDLMKPFLVVDHAGEPLFKVPKYLADYDQDNTPISKVSYVTILKEFETEYERVPNLAEANLDRAMKSISSMVSIGSDSLKDYFEFYYTLRNRYQDYYNNYNIAKYNEILKDINEKIINLKDRILGFYPEDPDYNDMELELEELEKEKEKYINLIKELNGEVKESDVEKHIGDNDDEFNYSSAFDYGDVDYDD